MKYFLKIISYAIPYKKYAFFNIFFNILYALFSALSFVALIPMLKVLFEDTKKVYSPPTYNGIRNIENFVRDSVYYEISKYIDKNSLIALSLTIGLIIILFFLKNLFGYLAVYFITFLRNGVLKDIRNNVYIKTTDLPINYFSEKKKGDIMSRITADVLEVQNSFLSVAEMFVREPLTIIITLFIMFKLNFQLTLYIIVFIPISGIIISVIGKALKRYSQKVQEEQGEFMSIIEETLNGIKVIKVFNANNTFTKKFKISTDKFFKYSNKLFNRQNLASPISEFLGIIVIGVLLWFGGKMVLIEKALDGAVFISYMALAYNILTPAKAISRASYSIKKGNAAAERILSILNIKNPMKNKPNSLDKKNFNKDISFKNVSFSYDSSKEVINDFNLKINKGQTVALVGQSGSGKTTIANLLNRFYDIQKGDINIDGKSLKDIKIKSLRNLMALVTQESILFNDSVYNNILLSKQNATKEEILKAAKIANAHDFITQLPQGYDTNIGDNGNKLSGGQKQRLTIARAVLKNPSILILDEATSALDTESEILVQKALENLMKNRTSLVIAHRLSTIQNADLIIVMQKGKIIEKGSHKELIKKNNGLYKQYIAMQSF